MRGGARARLEQLVDDGLVSLTLAAIAFAEARDLEGDVVAVQNFDAATARVSTALRGIRQVIEEG